MHSNERKRLKKLTQLETEAYAVGHQLIAGVDEAGRGPLAGPVVAAACIIPKGVYIENVNDSKQLSPKHRSEIFQQIKKTPGIRYGVGIVDSKTIDQLNIYQATIKAMLLAVAELDVQPDMLLVDGLQLSHPLIPSKKVIKGDTLSQSIAAASIIAKEARDALMLNFDLQWPQYGFKNHKGYGTPQHLLALAEHGPCDQHRRSFEPIKTRWAAYA